MVAIATKFETQSALTRLV